MDAAFGWTLLSRELALETKEPGSEIFAFWLKEHLGVAAIALYHLNGAEIGVAS
jgi:hypothetical protein